MRKEEEKKAAIVLTEGVGHLIDFTRIAERITASKSWIPHYSSKEMMDRGLILFGTFLAAGVGYRLSDKNTGATLNTAAAACAGFFVSHLAVIAPLIKKRYEVKQECVVLADQIRHKFKNHPALLSSFNNIIDKITALNYVENGRAQVSLTWGRRKRLMTVLYNELYSVDENKASDINLVLQYVNTILASGDIAKELTVCRLKSFEQASGAVAGPR